MDDTGSRANAEALVALALRLSPLLEPHEVTQACLEAWVELAASPTALFLSDDLPPAAIGMAAPSIEEARAIQALPAVRAAHQLLGINVLPSGTIPLPGTFIAVGSLPSKLAAPSLLVVARATPLDRATRQTLAAALPLIGQTLDRARRYAHAQAHSIARNDAIVRLAHDIRSPLVAAHASIEVVQRLLRSASVPAPVDEALAMGLRSVQNAVELCTDLLELSRLQHRMPLTIRQLNLAELVGDTCQMLQPLAQQRGLCLSANLPADPLSLHGDERLLRRALINLISNGLRFAPPQGLVQVTLESSREPEGYLIRVRDNGPGIKPVDRERIFQPFTQGSGEAGRGLGLGLALCAEVAQAHGGRIWVEDVPEGGACLVLLLPTGSHFDHRIGRFAPLEPSNQQRQGG